MNKNKTVTTVIIANGRFPSHPVPLSCIREAEYIICCDGAANDFIARGGVPDAIVGDCDSISEENKIRFADILHPNPDQETNDLTKSVQFCVENGRQEIIIVGGTGKREDHTLGNISLLADYAELAEVIMVTNWVSSHPFTQSRSLKVTRENRFPFSPSTLKSSPHITSNIRSREEY